MVLFLGQLVNMFAVQFPALMVPSMAFLGWQQKVLQGRSLHKEMAQALHPELRNDQDCPSTTLYTASPCRVHLTAAPLAASPAQPCVWSSNCITLTLFWLLFGHGEVLFIGPAVVPQVWKAITLPSPPLLATAPREQGRGLWGGGGSIQGQSLTGFVAVALAYEAAIKGSAHNGHGGLNEGLARAWPKGT